MLPLIWNKKIKAPPPPSPNSPNELLGLRIVTKHNIPNPNSNVVIKPILLLPQIPNSTNPNNLCFLKSCHLCHKSLPLDKEIYMYRGDLGFCSVACRERQIYLDEMKEIEISTKRILKSFRERQRRDGGGRCETGSLVDEFRQRRRGVPSEKNRVVFL